MDDGSLFCSVPDVLKAWDIIKESGAELGLFVNSQKCELILPSGHLDCFSIESNIIRVQSCTRTFLVVPLDQNPTANLGFPRNFFKKSLLYSRA
jgi:hypothetical protein